MKRVALVVGHKPSSKGAYNKTYDVFEFDFNNELVQEIEEKLTKMMNYELRLGDVRISLKKAEAKLRAH